jgi:hypothetical protein
MLELSPSRIVDFIVLICLVLSLTACSYMVVDKANKALKEDLQCDGDRVLMTDLTQPEFERHYLLPDTTPCVPQSENKTL